MIKFFLIFFLSYFFNNLTQHIIVIGSGLAGLSSAIASYDSDKNVKITILEKDEKVGGNSVLATSGMNALNTPAQNKKNILDTVNLFKKDVLDSGKTNDKKLVSVLAEHAHSAWDFLKAHGVELDIVMQGGGHGCARTHNKSSNEKLMPVGAQMVQALKKNIDKISNINLILNARVTDIDRNENGFSVIYTKNEKNEKINCDAVILATGGYGYDFDNLIKKYRPDLVSLGSTNRIIASGDGIGLGEKLGAQLINMDKIQLHPTGIIKTSAPEEKHKFLAPEALRAYGAILINSKGKRFVNELAQREVIVKAIKKQNDFYKTTKQNFAYLIFDEAIADKFGIDKVNFYVSKGYAKEFKNLSSLEREFGFKNQVAEHTVAQYNAQVLKYKFKKSIFPAELHIKQKWYIFIVTPAIHYTMGGLKINEHGQVIGKYGPIRGLYAAGEVTSGLHGNDRLVGNSLLESIVFGRISGEHATKN